MSILATVLSRYLIRRLLSAVIYDVDLVLHDDARVRIRVLRLPNDRVLTRLKRLLNHAVVVPSNLLLFRLRGDRRRSYMLLISHYYRIVVLHEWMVLSNMYYRVVGLFQLSEGTFIDALDEVAFELVLLWL